MENEKQTSERETPAQHWRSCKLLIDPALTRGLYKVYRYDGLHFNIAVEDLGLFPVETVRDPRICRLWSRSNKTELLVSKFKVDEWYVGPVPPKEVTFSRLNDNVKEAFLTNMCKKYGNIEEVEVFYNPKNKKHLGIAKVVFDTVKSAREAIQGLHQTSVMGNLIHVETDPKGENRARYLQLLFSGLYTPWTLPVGSSEQALQSLIDSLLYRGSTQRRGSVSSPSSVATPLSLDTVYSSIWQDTPRSQGTPRTPCLSATPLSQDSCYSSLQATPILQGEPSASAVHNPLRRALCHRKPARLHHRGPGEVSDVSLILKHCQEQPLRSLSAHVEASRQQTPAHNDTEPFFNLASPCEEFTDKDTTAKALHVNSNCLNIMAAASPPADHSSGTDFCPPADDCSSSSPLAESLDSRIESLLINSKSAGPSYFDRTLEADVHSQASPTSPRIASKALVSHDSLDCFESFTPSHHCSPNEPVGDSPTWLVENEEDETAQAVSFLTRNSQSPTLCDFTHFERTDHVHNDEKDAGGFQSSSCPKEHHVADEDKEHSSGSCRALTPTKDISSLPQPPSLPSPVTPPALRSGCSNPPVAPFLFPFSPFPASLSSIPPRLSNGTIPIPPPGWIPPPGHPTSRPIPPPSLPPPPTFLRPPPPLMILPSVPPPVHLYPLPMQPAGPLDKGTPLPLLPPPWPAPPLPRFNPFVPPPNFPLLCENAHKYTVEKVLQVIMNELRSVIKKDITRRMIEGVAFKAFEDWWDCQEKKAKTQVSPLKSGTASMEDRTKQITPPSHSLSGNGKKPPLPSFKVKKKRAHDPTASEEVENKSSSNESAGMKPQGDDILRSASERAKRRHARPQELDSDDDDDDKGKEEDKTLQHEETISAKANATVQDNDDPPILCAREDSDDADKNHPEEEKEFPEQPEEEEAVRLQTSRGADCSTSESSSSEESEYSSDFESSDSLSLDDLSSSDLSPEDGDVEECIIISSDEESMELDPPVTPSAPLTPGAQLELSLQEWSALLHGEEAEGEQCTSCPQHDCDLDATMELQINEPQDLLQPPSPIGLPAVEPHLDTEMDGPEWMVGPLENTQRPLTPTGSLVDSDTDLMIRSKPPSPTVEVVERPQTPGKQIAADLDSEDSASEVLSFSPTISELCLLAPSDPAASYPSYRDIPKTPGREDRGGWTQCSSGRAPPTPGRETAPSEGSSVKSRTLSSPLSVPCVASNPYITAPKTPGRDIILPRRTIAYRRKTQMAVTSQTLCDSLRASPASASSPCSLSESSSDSADGPCVRMKPLQGLENMPGLLDEESRRDSDKSSWRRKQLTRLKRRWRLHQRSLQRIPRSISSHSRPHRPRGERRILHRFWKEGLDEEDARLLRCVYDTLQEQDSGCGWVSDTLWIPHPLTKVVTEWSEELTSRLPRHMTGSARSEGFYRISMKDKLKYLSNTKLPAEMPSTSTQQGMCIPAQQTTSLRSGSDFRSEQRRLLSSFSCDSDLVKFNQLKFRKKRIRFSPSHIHEWGLFAMEPIAADEMVIEYVGQIIRQVIADMREQRYEEEGIGSSYLFRVDQDTIIDATKCGNLARFINHSCNPNCYAKIITVESQKKIVIYSRQPISVNEEITYDYKFPIEETKIPCLCGADSCRGSLN